MHIIILVRQHMHDVQIYKISEREEYLRVQLGTLIWYLTNDEQKETLDKFQS